MVSELRPVGDVESNRYRWVPSTSIPCGKYLCAAFRRVDPDTGSRTRKVVEAHSSSYFTGC